MKIVKVIPESFQDYDDHIAVVLFVYGCNFKCSYCYNYEFVTNPNLILPYSPLDIVDSCVTPLTDGLVWLGGEPTIYGDKLLEVSKQIKDRHDIEIKLFTNGSNPQVVLDGVKDGLFDCVSIDFKTITNRSIINYGKNHSTASHILTLFSLFDGLTDLGAKDNVEIRTTQAAAISDDEVREIGSICDYYDFRHIVQRDVSDSYKRLGLLPMNTDTDVPHEVAA